MHLSTTMLRGQMTAHMNNEKEKLNPNTFANINYEVEKKGEGRGKEWTSRGR